MIKKLLVIFLLLLIGFGGGILYVKLTEHNETANLSEVERYFLRQILLSTNSRIIDDDCDYLGKKDNIPKEKILVVDFFMDYLEYAMPRFPRFDAYFDCTIRGKDTCIFHFGQKNYSESWYSVLSFKYDPKNKEIDISSIECFDNF